MQATELKTGNYIHLNKPLAEGSKLVRVGLIGKHKINGINETMFVGIPLTEEWLDKLGFQKKETDTGTTWYIGINPVTEDYMLALTWLDNFDRPFYGNGHFKIDTVHQLQNLYFSLTGEELTLKEK